MYINKLTFIVVVENLYTVITVCCVRTELTLMVVKNERGEGCNVVIG